MVNLEGSKGFNLPEKGKYVKVAVGGTFDTIHAGHEKLLKTAFEVGDRVVIGLSTDELAKDLHKSHTISSFNDRKEGLLKLLIENQLLDKTEVIPINDRYGITVEDVELEALVVSRDTLRVAELINSQRIKRGLTPLEIVVVEILSAEDGKQISTTRIKKGEISKEGRLLKSGLNRH